MSKPIPAVQKYMTTSPHSVGPNQPLRVAHDMLCKLQVRHLPVLSGGHLVGMLTARDLSLVETLDGVNADDTLVEDAMSTNVYAVVPSTLLDEVVNAMAEHKYGSAVVVENQKVVGIFTTVDVCKALSELLHTRLKNQSGRAPCAAKTMQGGAP